MFPNPVFSERFVFRIYSFKTGHYLNGLLVYLSWTEDSKTMRGRPMLLVVSHSGHKDHDETPLRACRDG